MSSWILLSFAPLIIVLIWGFGCSIGWFTKPAGGDDGWGELIMGTLLLGMFCYDFSDGNMSSPVRGFKGNVDFAADPERALWLILMEILLSTSLIWLGYRKLKRKDPL